jgi:hypothetical protein
MNTNISKHFKLFCSSLVVDLLLKLGNLLRIEILSRDIKTVNCNVVCSVLDIYFIVTDSNPDSMREYVQSKFNDYNRFISEKKEKHVGKNSVGNSGKNGGNGAGSGNKVGSKHGNVV